MNAMELDMKTTSEFNIKETTNKALTPIKDQATHS